MGLFGKKKETACSCGCDTQTQRVAPAAEGEKNVKVLGGGCPKCNALEAVTKEALAELGMDTEVEHVTDFAQIATYGVMSTPALVVDGKVVSVGKVLSKADVVKLLQK